MVSILTSVCMNYQNSVAYMLTDKSAAVVVLFWVGMSQIN